MTFYDVVVFDAAGTLIGRESPHHFEEYFIIAAQEVGHTLSVEDVQAAVEQRYKDTQARLGGTRMTAPAEARKFWVDLYESVLHDAGIKEDIRDGIERFYDRFQEGHYLEVYSDVLPVLNTLKQHKVRMGILSNWSEHLEDLLDRLNILHYFEFVVVSAKVGYEKPDGRIFDLTLNKAEVPHNRVLYIGDNPEDDIQAARQVGIDALLIDRHKQHDRFRLPSIQSLGEIPGYLGITDDTD